MVDLFCLKFALVNLSVTLQKSVTLSSSFPLILSVNHKGMSVKGMIPNDSVLFTFFAKHNCIYIFSCISVSIIKLFRRQEKSVLYTVVLVQMIICAETRETCKTDEHFHIAVRKITRDCNVIQYIITMNNTAAQIMQSELNTLIYECIYLHINFVFV